ncbi:hypothetical protein BU15DRAFT_83550 [Melanogaster broomeanus]|nr:hypothetical protein BU15DRAFT_83550 [Melanogaster broomeanus]
MPQPLGYRLSVRFTVIGKPYTNFLTRVSDGGLTIHPAYLFQEINFTLMERSLCHLSEEGVAVVVTGLENQEGVMEDWWAANETEFAALRMHFDGHACVATLDPEKVHSSTLRQRCLASRQAVLSMIANTCSRNDWGTGQESWLAAAMADVRAMVSPKRRSKPPPAPNVVIYDLSEHSQPQIGPSKDKSPFPGRLMHIEDSPLNVYRVRDRQLLAGGQFKKKVTSRGADLLIFCASIGAALQESWRKLVSFYESYGGEARSLLVVVRGDRRGGA